MRPVILCLCVALLPVTLCAQAIPARNGKGAVIKAAKNVLISIFDANLPGITLQYFLKYESNGVPVDWTIVTCDERATSAVVDREDRISGKSNKTALALCVQATVDDVRAQRSVVVVVQVGTIGAGVVGAPKLRLVMAQDENGAFHGIQLIDLPAAMHRWRPPPRIRDLPKRLGAVA